MEKSFGVTATALDWISSYLQPRSQQIVIGNTRSDKFQLQQGVPQGSCLGPVLFTQYSSSVFHVIDQHEKDGHGYADDHQIYAGFSAACYDNESRSMEYCVEDIRNWMKTMMLKMNDSKTEFIVIGTQQQLAKCSSNSITIGNQEIPASDFVRNLGAYFDKHMSMEHHIRVKCKAAYAQLYNISKVRRYLDQKTAEILIHSLVHSHIDYCNSLLIGVPKYLIKKMQMVQNTAARILWRVRKHDPITPTLKMLHWLPVAYRIKFKVCVITFYALHNIGPEYIRDMLTIRDSEYNLRSMDTITLQVPRSKFKTLGDRAFYVAAPREWNSLPSDLRSIVNPCAFKSKLKTHLFKMAYY